MDCWFSFVYPFLSLVQARQVWDLKRRQFLVVPFYRVVVQGFVVYIPSPRQFSFAAILLVVFHFFYHSFCSLLKSSPRLWHSCNIVQPFRWLWGPHFTFSFSLPYFQSIVSIHYASMKFTQYRRVLPIVIASALRRKTLMTLRFDDADIQSILTFIWPLSNCTRKLSLLLFLHAKARDLTNLRELWVLLCPRVPYLPPI